MSATIREWARSQGLAVAERGLIPRDIVQQYKDAHGIGDDGRASIMTTTVHTARMEVVRVEPAPDAPMRTLGEWLELRDELASIIRSGMSPEETAERILLNDWAPPR